MLGGHEEGFLDERRGLLSFKRDGVSQADAMTSIVKKNGRY